MFSHVDTTGYQNISLFLFLVCGMQFEKPAGKPA